MTQTILGIDPGLTRCGFGIVRASGPDVEMAGQDITATALLATEPERSRTADAAHARQKRFARIAEAADKKAALEAVLPEAFAAVREAGLHADDVEIRKADLEDVFLDVMHRHDEVNV